MAKGKRRQRKRDHEAIKHDLIVFLSKGLGWTKCCEKAGISRSTGYNLRTRDPEFAAEVNRLLMSPLHQQRIAVSKGGSEAAKYQDWQRQFAVQYRLTGDRIVAANAVDKTITEILSMLDPSSDEYDEEFATVMADEDNRRLVEVEDSAFRQATTGGNLQAQKYILDSLSKKFGRIKPTDSKTMNLFWFSDQHESLAKDVLNELFSNESAENARRLLEA